MFFSFLRIGIPCADDLIQIDSLDKILAISELSDNLTDFPSEKLFNIGKIYENHKSDYPNAIIFYKLASEKAAQENSPEYIIYESWLAYTLSKTGESQEAIEKLLTLVEAVESSDENSKLPRIYLLLAFAYRDARIFEKAEVYFRKSLEVSNILNDSTDIHTILAEIGNLLSMKGDNKSALDFHLNALKIREQSENKSVLIYSYHDISLIYFALDSIDLALKYLLKADSIAVIFNEKWMLASIYASLSEIYIKRNIIAKAEPYLHKLRIIAADLNMKSVNVTTNHAFYIYFKALNNSDSALKYFETEQIYKDSISNQEIQKSITEFEKKYEISRKDKLLLKTQEDVKRQRIIIIASIFGFLIVLVSLIIISRLNNHKQLALEQLENQNRKILKQKEEIRIKAEQLNELNVTKDKLFSIIAHDLRSPFVGIQGFSDLLLDTPEDYSSEETKLFIEQINISAKTTLDLLEKLLSWAKNQTGKISFNPESVNIQSLILESFESLKPSAKIKNISLFCVCDNNIQAFADKEMLRTIIRNLIQNSVKFTNPEGRITVSAKRLEGFIEISVKDSGVGMNEITLNNIFSIKEKHSSLGTANERGSGLGLILCKDFIEKNGGVISVKSTPGVGSTFSFTIPIS